MPEVRLIDANVLHARICEDSEHNYGASANIAQILLQIETAPTIEAEPVRHGKLLEGKTFNDQHCSVCGQRFRDDISFILPSDENGFPMPKRCPECGCYWGGGADNGNG